MADSPDDLRINTFKVTASGSGHDAADIENIRLISDRNGNGVYDSEDTEIASGRYERDNGTITFESIGVVQSYAISSLLIVYDLKGSAENGQTF